LQPSAGAASTRPTTRTADEGGVKARGVKTTDEGGAAAAAVGKVLDALLVLATKPAKWELHIDSRLEIGLHLDSFVEAFVHRQMRLANETEYEGPLMTLDCL
jgi:hypothetical protein